MNISVDNLHTCIQNLITALPDELRNAIIYEKYANRITVRLLVTATNLIGLNPKSSQRACRSIFNNNSTLVEFTWYFIISGGIVCLELNGENICLPSIDKAVEQLQVCLQPFNRTS